MLNGGTRIIGGFLILALALSTTARAAESRSPASLEVAARLLNARELVGSAYSKSIVCRSGEKVSDMGDYIREWLGKSLPLKYRGQASAVTEVILERSLHYGFDPVLVTSIIATESAFNPEAVGKAGEIGLMQLRPETARWIASKFDLPFKGAARKQLRNMVTNIRIGTAYLSYLRQQFNAHGRLYLTAYNMGKMKLIHETELHERPRDYACRVMRHYLRYYKRIHRDLHAQELATAAAVEEAVALD